MYVCVSIYMSPLHWKTWSSVVPFIYLLYLIIYPENAIYRMSYWDIISHPSDWQKAQKFDNIFCWQGQRNASNLICCWWGYRMEQLSQRGIWRYVTKLQQHLLLDLAVPLPSIYWDNIITDWRQRCIRSFKVLSITAKTVDSANARHQGSSWVRWSINTDGAPCSCYDRERPLTMGVEKFPGSAYMVTNSMYLCKKRGKVKIGIFT